MSPGGQSDGEAGATAIASFPLRRGATLDRHDHDRHQLAWASVGVLSVHTDRATWVLPPNRALFIPAQVAHEVATTGGAMMTAVYLPTAGRAPGWIDATPVLVGGLLRALIAHLGDDRLDDGRRARAEAVLVDALQPVAVATIDPPLPTDPRALEVAIAIGDDPADARTLTEWGRHVGASGRTIARAFVADTGIPFGRWRTLARLGAALGPLAAGEPVGSVAHAVGYDTASAFVLAFRRQTGQTPGAYFAAGTDEDPMTR